MAAKKSDFLDSKQYHGDASFFKILKALGHL